MPLGCGLQRHGRLELLQLLHGNRRVFLEETGRASAGVAAGLGDHGDMAASRGAAGSGAEGDRPRVRELSTLATGSGKTAEEPGVLHGCGAASHGRGAGSSGGQRTKKGTRSEGNASPRRDESLPGEGVGKGGGGRQKGWQGGAANERPERGGWR